MSAESAGGGRGGVPVTAEGTPGRELLLQPFPASGFAAAFSLAFTIDQCVIFYESTRAARNVNKIG